jgi:hypothetical protein
MPGTDPRAALRLVLDTVPELPFLPELPARGPGAEMTGRALVLAAAVPAAWGPTGWAVTDRPGRDLRRAASWLGEDLDTFEELLDGYDGTAKVQVCGPWTLAATVELRNGRRAVSDPGAARDLGQALAEGVAAHVADVRRRVPHARLVVQLDEPGLPAVLAGGLPSPSGLAALPSVEPGDVEAGLATVVRALPTEVAVCVHCCAASPPWAVLRSVGLRGVSVDATLLGAGDADDLAETLDAGLALALGVVPTSGPLPTAAAAVARVRELWHLAAQPDDRVAEVAVTPACGLAGVSPDQARGALTRCRSVASALTDDPERPA